VLSYFALLCYVVLTGAVVYRIVMF